MSKRYKSRSAYISYERGRASSRSDIKKQRSTYLLAALVYTTDIALYLLALFCILHAFFIAFGAIYGFYDFRLDTSLRAYHAFVYHDIKPMCIVMGLGLLCALLGSYGRAFYNALILTLTTLLIFLTFGDMLYYLIFFSSYDYRILMLFNDGLDGAFSVLRTGASSQLPVFTLLFLAIISSIINALVFKKVSKTAFVSRLKKSALVVVAIIYVLVFGAITLRSYSYLKIHYVHPVSEPFLLNISNGPFRELFLVYRAAKKANYADAYRHFAHGLSPREIVEELFKGGAKADLKAHSTSNAKFDSTSSGAETHSKATTNSNVPINLAPLLEHSVANDNASYDYIFYNVGESLPYYALENKDFNLGHALNKIIDDYKKTSNALVLPALENAATTAKSLSAQLTGLYQMDLEINLDFHTRDLMAIARMLKKAGYHTYFVYAGTITWGNLDRFSKKIGFDKVLFADDITEFAKRKGLKEPYELAWGVSDDLLFSFLANYNFPKKSFVFTMSTAAHPPFDTDVANRPNRADVKGIEAKLAAIPNNGRGDTGVVIGHTEFYLNNYASFINTFIKRARTKGSGDFANSLFLATGDHTNRHIYRRQSALYNLFVPFVAISPTHAIYTDALIANQLDIAPSILGIALPKGSKYYSFSKGLLSQTPSLDVKKSNPKSMQNPQGANSQNKDPRLEDIKLGYFDVATPCYVTEKSHIERLGLYPSLCGFSKEVLEDANLRKEDIPKEVAKRLEAGKYRLDLYKALSTYILEHGFVVK